MGSEAMQTQPIDRILERTARLVALLVGISIVWQMLRPASPFLAYWGIWFVVFYALTIGFGTPTEHRTRRIRRGLIGVVLLGALVLSAVQVYHHKEETKAAQIMATFEKALATRLWIAYEPASVDPYENEYASAEEIRGELQVLAGDSFDGVITFSASGSLADIPRIAKEVGFRAVIMGIINVVDNEELSAAISVKEYVDAYCVGHMFTDYPYSQTEVLQALDIVRSSTGRPISTTLRPNGYLVFPEVSNAIDFFFPDIHANWYYDGSAHKALKATEEYVREVRRLQARYPNKPVLLKLISIPSEEVPGASTEQQYQFYRQVVEYVESSMTFPERVYPSYFSAFDLPWKSPERGWPPGERYLGFYDASGRCKVASVAGAEVRVVDALKWSRVVTAQERVGL